MSTRFFQNASLDELQAFEALDSANDFSAVVAHLRDRLGLKHICYHSPVVPGHSMQDPYLLLTYSDDWVTHYKSAAYVQIDPVFNRGARSMLPLNWSSLPKSESRALRMFSEARDAGIGPNGITVPVRGPASGLWGLFSGSSDEPQRDWDLRWPELVRDTVVAANYLHTRVMEQFAGETLADLDALTRRETEALKWAAEGRSAKLIAHLMGIAPDTVHAHLDSARHKLCALNRSHAIVKALRAGIIH